MSLAKTAAAILGKATAAHFGSPSIWAEHFGRKPWVRLSGRKASTRRGLSVQIELKDGELPTEIRLFKAGVNPTRNGPYLFDDEAAELTMAAYAEHGVEIMIDLEHLSVPHAAQEITGDGRNFDPDARAWARLELRNGELWAVDVSWTPDGKRRLENRTQRFVSPAFDVDESIDPPRVIAIHNIALTAIPATDDAFPLVARQKGQEMKLSDFLKKWTKLTTSQRSLPGAKLLELLAIDMDTLKRVVKAMGGDPAGDITSLFATVRQFAEELKASVTGEPAPEPVEPAAEGDNGGMLGDNPKPDEEPAAAMSRAVADVRQVSQRNKALETEVTKLRADQDKRDAADKVQRFRLAIADPVCDLNPGKVWHEGEAGKLKPRLARMSLDDIDEMIKDHGGQPNALCLQAVTPRPAGQAASHVPQFPGAKDVEMGEPEEQRLRFAMDRQNALLRKDGRDELVLTSVIERYVEVKAMQVRGAKTGDERAERGGKLGGEERPLICAVSGQMTHSRLEMLATNPVAPAEQFGFSSREAMREFNEAYMVGVATMPRDWISEVGDVQPSGALEITYPLDFSDPKWRKFVAQESQGETPQSADIEVAKEKYGVAKSADWDRLQRDFAYMNTWLAGGAQFARGRNNLRSYLIVNLLVANPLWAVSRQKPSGLTGKSFFATDHPINPFNDKVKGPNGLTTYSNFSNTGSPLNAENLSDEKDAMVLVPYLDGVPFGDGAGVSHILHPTILTRTAGDLLTVQNLILAGALIADSGAGVGTMGQVTNPHFNSGLLTIQAPHLPGATPATADYYLFSQGIAAQGYVPWVLAEDLAEMVIDHDTSSHHFKTTNYIKTERRLNISAVLVWQHAIRKVLAVAP